MIQIGQKVYSGLYGGRNGVVFAIHGTQRPETIGSIGGVISYGGNAEFDIVFENGTISRRLPESILHGVQWKIFDEVISAEEIKKMLDFAAAEDVRKATEAKAKAEEFTSAKAQLKADPRYSHLQQFGQGGKSMHAIQLAAINIRRDLKKTFPGVKFSVTTSHHTEVRIAWMDGPVAKLVREVVDRYSGGYFDGMSDIYEYSDTPWNTVFGSAKYVNITRKHSVAALTAAVAAVSKDFGWPVVPVKTWEDGSAWVNLGDSNRDRILHDYLEGRYQVFTAAA